MANKYKKIYENNLQTIREELGYTQKRMGEIFKVSEKTIRNYEYFEQNFPLESAMYLSKTYGYTLDWIYKNSGKKTFNSENNPETNMPKEISKFVIDIRDFISRSDNNIHFTIPDYYWIFIKQYNQISSSNLSNYEKKRELAKIEANYKNKKTEGLCYRFSIPESEFSSFLHFDDSFIPYADTNIISDAKCEPTDEQKQEVMSFLDSLFD